MADDTEAVISVAEKAENVVAHTLNAATDKVTVVAQANGGFDLLGVPFWEVFITFVIMVLVCDLFFRKLIAVTFNVHVSTKRNMICHSIIFILFISGSYVFCYFTDISAGILIRVLFAVAVWICTKYLRRLLDLYFVRWSQRRFGERRIMHNMLKDIIKRVLIVIALFLTFAILRISIVKFFSMEIPAYVGVFVLVPLLVRMNLLSFFSVINKGFVIGNFIQIGNESNALSGTCVAVNFSGVTLEMVNGESVILKLARVASADVINYSTRLSHRCLRVYYVDVTTEVGCLRELPHNIKNIIKKYDSVILIQCNYIFGTAYRHEILVIFDVVLNCEINSLLRAKCVMDSVYCDIVFLLQNHLAKMPVYNAIAA